MKLSDARVEQIVTAFAECKTPITPDLANDLAAASQNYDEIKIMDLYGSRVEQHADRLSPQNIATNIWNLAKAHRSLRKGDALPIYSIANELQKREGYSGEEIAKGLQYLANNKRWIKDGDPITLTQDGFNHL